jgi:hypothetical protein
MSAAKKTGLSPTWQMHTCIDRVIPRGMDPQVDAGHDAGIIVARNITRGTPLHELDANTVHTARMALISVKKWPNLKKLRVRFLDGTATQKAKVQAQAKSWEKFANVQIVFGNDPGAEVRVSFKADPGSWSAVGTDCLVKKYFPTDEPTMNFGWLEDNTPATEYRRVVVHEFGHALGCIHEHQSPTEQLKWDKAAVYATFSGPPNNWSKADIDSNILEKYSPAGISASVFDIKSIMLYQFDASLFIDHKGTPENTKLSPLDKSFISKMYPK